MSYVDLESTLRDWPYEAEKISVRKVLGAGGSVKIQMRVELGILQLEAEGRPDGSIPYGCQTLVDYHQKRLTRHEETTGAALGYGLTSEECHCLRLEASLFYRRYIAYFVLEEYANVYRDTAHSLRVFDLCRDYAIDPEDRTTLEEFRPYVLMMDARAQAYQASEQGEPASALAHVNRGIMYVKSHLEQQGRSEAIRGSEELKILRALGAEFSQDVPRGSLIATRKALQSAIDEERFEEAARLRDELDSLRPGEGAAGTS